MNPKNFQLAKQLRQELHQNPELSNKEIWTKKHLIEFFKKHTSLKIVDRGLWFYAIYHAGEDKPNIAFRADFDAVPMDEGIKLPHGSQNPGVSHKCGHDGHAAGEAKVFIKENNIQEIFAYHNMSGIKKNSINVILE